VIGLIGTKLGMTQVFDAAGELVPVTVVRTGPCTVVQVRTKDRDGYDAVQLGFDVRAEDDKGLRKPERGHAKASGKPGYRVLSEWRVSEPAKFQVGQEVRVAEVFSAGDKVDVAGTTKGRGFAGVVKRHNFGGHRQTHGTHESYRGPGSIGARSYPGRVWKNKRMDGHMGDVRRTIQNLDVVAVREGDDVLLLRGGLPGPTGGYVMIRRAVKARRR
jgi:large subunit ribosomal protein L3